MANWAYVDDNKITELCDFLPSSWKNVSGLNLSYDNLPFLKSLGWYPVVKQNDSYDDVNYFINSYDYEIRENDVYATYILSEKPYEPSPSQEELKNKFMEELRKERNKRLLESDWTQLLDVQVKFDNTTKLHWIQYRQQLRDITDVYNSVDIFDLNQVQWPFLENY
jgi:hypothetical protein